MSADSSCYLPSWRLQKGPQTGSSWVVLPGGDTIHWQPLQLSVNFTATWADLAESLNLTVAGNVSPIHHSDSSQLVGKRQAGNTRNPCRPTLKRLEKKKVLLCKVGRTKAFTSSLFVRLLSPMLFNHFTSLHLVTDWQKGCASANKPDTALKKTAAYMKLEIPREMKVQSQKIQEIVCAM